MKSIHIFDLDNTLTKTPSFVDFLKTDDNGVIKTDGKFSDYFKTIQNYIHLIFSKDIEFHASNDKIYLYDKNKKSYLGDEYIQYFLELNPNEIESIGIKKSFVNRISKNFESDNGRLLLRHFPGFHSDPETIGKTLNEPVYKIYSSVKNKMILTGRQEKLRPYIEDVLFNKLKIDKPEFGLKLYNSNEGISNYKNREIEKTIIDNNWDEVHFYEDRKDWLDNAALYIKEKFPKIKFIKHFIHS